MSKNVRFFDSRDVKSSEFSETRAISGKFGPSKTNFVPPECILLDPSLLVRQNMCKKRSTVLNNTDVFRHI